MLNITHSDGRAAARRRAVTASRARDLFAPRSLVGALAVLAVLCFFGLGMQALDNAVRHASGFQVGEQFQISDSVAFTPAPGWVNDPVMTVPGSAVVATKNGWEIKIAGGLVLQPGQTIEDFGKIFHDLDQPDREVTAMETFATTSGLHGVVWESHGTPLTSITWEITDGSQIVQILADGPSDTLSSVKDELTAMAASLTMRATAEVTS